MVEDPLYHYGSRFLAINIYTTYKKKNPKCFAFQMVMKAGAFRRLDC